MREYSSASSSIYVAFNGVAAGVGVGAEYFGGKQAAESKWSPGTEVLTLEVVR
jgi:hypothetical protein